jgi:intracellular septation protein A
MWKIVVVLLLTALALLVARLAYDAPAIKTRVGAAIELQAPALVTPPLMYAGVRG